MPGPAKLPAGQSVHAFADAAAADPAGQGVQTALSVASKYVPARQFGVPVIVTPAVPMNQAAAALVEVAGPMATQRVPVGFVNCGAVGAAKMRDTGAVVSVVVGFGVDDVSVQAPDKDPAV